MWHEASISYRTIASQNTITLVPESVNAYRENDSSMALSPVACQESDSRIVWRREVEKNDCVTIPGPVFGGTEVSESFRVAAP
jgi:hypothetical protein